MSIEFLVELLKLDLLEPEKKKRKKSKKRIAPAIESVETE